MILVIVSAFYTVYCIVNLKEDLLWDRKDHGARESILHEFTVEVSLESDDRRVRQSSRRDQHRTKRAKSVEAYSTSA